nr:hypothetical protein [Actinomycetota bacterium]
SFGRGGCVGGVAGRTGFAGVTARRVRVGARRRGTVVVEGTLARVVDVSCRGETGSTTVDGGAVGSSAAPARDATNPSTPAKTMTALTTASCLRHHIKWFSERYRLP